MNRVYVRPIRQDEAQVFFEWAKENEDKSKFDPAVPLFPSSTTWCAYDKDGPLAYQTIQQPLMLESLSPRPGNTSAQNALAMKELTKTAITLAHSKGVGEILFLGSDDATDTFASNHIFERLPYAVFRIKLRELEGIDVNNHAG